MLYAILKDYAPHGVMDIDNSKWGNVENELLKFAMRRFGMAEMTHKEAFLCGHSIHYHNGINLHFSDDQNNIITLTARKLVEKAA